VMVAHTPIGPIGSPDDIAKEVLFWSRATGSLHHNRLQGVCTTA